MTNGSNPGLHLESAARADHAHHWLQCQGCGETDADADARLACRWDHAPALLRSVYAGRRLTLRTGERGVNRFSDWLPIHKAVPHEGLPGVYQSTGLAAALGLTDLWIAFSGYWPERGATLRTTTFKELEAPAVCGRLGTDSRVLVVASAGNTARGFAEVCSGNDSPLLLVVPRGAESAIWSTKPFAPSVRLLVVIGADYYDAIAVADAIASLPGFVAEGGSKNVARRDGLGTPVLAATFAMGRLPHHYFQAVGSGAGGIAAWEATHRLREDGRFGVHKTRLHLAQNAPFTPMTDAWKRRDRLLDSFGEEEWQALIGGIEARVLSNRRPPYGVTGGVFDALSDTDGCMYAVGNEDIRRCIDLVQATEHIDIGPAAAVAVGALRQAVAQMRIRPGETVLLHLTEGGQRRLFAEHDVHTLAPTLAIAKNDATPERLRALIASSSAKGMLQ